MHSDIFKNILIHILKIKFLSRNFPAEKLTRLLEYAQLLVAYHFDYECFGQIKIVKRLKFLKQVFLKPDI